MREREAVTSGRQRRVHKVLQDPNSAGKPALKEVFFTQCCIITAILVLYHCSVAEFE